MSSIYDSPPPPPPQVVASNIRNVLFLSPGRSEWQEVDVATLHAPSGTDSHRGSDSGSGSGGTPRASRLLEHRGLMGGGLRASME